MKRKPDQGNWGKVTNKTTNRLRGELNGMQGFKLNQKLTK